MLASHFCSNNSTQFLSKEWLQETLHEDVTERKELTYPVQPDWSLVLGTFHHTRDENFEEFLIGVGRYANEEGS